MQGKFTVWVEEAQRNKYLTSTARKERNTSSIWQTALPFTHLCALSQQYPLLTKPDFSYEPTVCINNPCSAWERRQGVVAHRKFQPGLTATGQMREILIQFNHHELKPMVCRLHVIAVIKGKRKEEMNCRMEPFRDTDMTEIIT